MAQRNKQWFFSTPQTSSYNRFSQYNKPVQSTYQDLMDSVAMFLELGSTASTTQQGLVKIVSDANAITRTSASTGNYTEAVMPHQLPMLIVTGSTEITLAGFPTGASNGIKVTPISITSGGKSRLSYKVELDPNTLSTKGSPALVDSVVINDVAGGNVPKKATLTSIQALISSSNYWTLSSDDLSPSSSYKLFMSDHIHFDGVNDYQIYQDADASGAGHMLKIYAGGGAAGFAAGNLRLYGGVGIGGGTDGNVEIAYNGSANGVASIGCAADTSYMLKVCGNVRITGTCTIDTPSAGPPTGIATINGTNGLINSTPKAMMDLVVGSTLAARAIPYFTGAAWTSLATGAVVDKYLMINGAGNLAFDDLVLTGKVVDASVAVGAAIALTKLATVTANRVLLSNGSGYLSASTVTNTELGYLSGTTSAIQTQIDDMSYMSASKGSGYFTTDFDIDADFFSYNIMDITSNNVDASLPRLVDVPIGTTYTVCKKFTGGAFTGRVITHGGTGDLIVGPSLGAGATSYTIPGATGSSCVVVKRSAAVWDVVSVSQL